MEPLHIVRILFIVKSKQHLPLSWRAGADLYNDSLHNLQEEKATVPPWDKMGDQRDRSYYHHEGQ